MPEIDRPGRNTEWIDVAFVERERTPECAVRVGIQLRLDGLSLSNTKQHLERFGVEPSRTAIHDWIRKADRQLDSDVDPNQFAVDETVIRVNGQRHWLFAGATPTRISSSTFSYFRRERRNSRCRFFANYVRNSRSHT